MSKNNFVHTDLPQGEITSSWSGYVMWYNQPSEFCDWLRDYLKGKKRLKKKHLKKIRKKLSEIPTYTIQYL